MPWFDDMVLGTPAYAIAASVNPRIRVVAGPGTGKSFAVKRRVARLLEENVEPDCILPVTFTRVAAEDLHRELVGMNVPRCNELNGLTLHSLSLKMLMRNHVLEELASGSLASILLFDPNANCLRHGAAPSLPIDYMRAIDGAVIGPSIGSCGTAAYRAEPVMVCDIATDPLWVDFRELALAHELRACWSTPILSSRGKVLGTFAIYYREPRSPTAQEHNVIQQITNLASIAVERELVEEALHQARAELAHVARVTTLGELTASIAHEVNQPLAAIATNGEACMRFLNRGVPDLAELRDAVTCMINDSHRAGQVIKRLRAMSKKEGLQKLGLDINDVINEALLLVRRELSNYRVALRVDLALGLAPVVGDRIQLQQVIINFVMNSIDAMTAIADRPRELWIRSGPHNVDQVLVAVQDSGAGIDPEKIDQVFDAFFTTKQTGMGMGLSICRSIIEAHGGRVSASNNVGPGATFKFILPSSGVADERKRAL